MFNYQFIQSRPFIILLIFLAGLGQATAQEAEKITLPNTEMTYLESEYVPGTKYKIEVILPPGYNPSENKSYPVLFYLDAYMTTGTMSNASFILSVTQMIEPVIMVGINFDGNLKKFFAIRGRDYTPTYISPDSLGEHASRIPESGGGPNFLNFIEQELIPFVDSKYRINKNDMGILGYSLGGLFNTWMLTESPNLFKRYAICSPALGWDNFKVLKTLESQTIENPKTIFISLTEGEEPAIQTGFKRLNNFLENNKNVTLIYDHISGENHFSGVPATYMRAVRKLYQKETNSPEIR